MLFIMDEINSPLTQREREFWHTSMITNSWISILDIHEYFSFLITQILREVCVIKEIIFQNMRKASALICQMHQKGKQKI